MVSDSESLVTGESHKSRCDVNRLFAVSVRKSILDGVIGHGYPSAVFLNVTAVNAVEIDLAKIVKKRGDRDAFVAVMNAVTLRKTALG